jgi:ParB/RepB/Spo0J family partition protein
MVDKMQSIELSKLVAHPDNPNVMSGEKFKKLVRNIERTGLYEPIVVRQHPKSTDKFQIINGHHRVKALEKLGRKEANCIVWEVDDAQTAILLTTLNRLGGTDQPVKKIELLAKLKEKFGSAKLAKLLPNTRKQIEQLTSLKLNTIRCLPPVKQLAIPLAVPLAVPLVFFVSQQQQTIIEKSISEILRCAANDKKTKSQRRAASLTQISEHFLSFQDRPVVV